MGISSYWTSLPCAQFSNRRTSSINSFQRSIPERGLDDHKEKFGIGLVIGGNDLMLGAVGMSAKTALNQQVTLLQGILNK
ncbi:hypothetical protein [Ornithinibacillus halophilus]|uniref:hypothetical protein n=1 Tax=Ornithinibacillus halophilus TaxID=930117 RepID=UPI000933430C|nr:hypothetical protein [Ornithinibacillus halophilus]